MTCAGAVDRPRTRLGRWLALVLLGTICGAGVAPVFGQDPPIYQQEPFDQVTLDKANGNAVLKVLPLDLPNRQVPQDPRPSDRLRVRLLDRPDDEYEVVWQNIDKVELFEQLVLAEAERLAAAGKYDEAFDHFAFLWRVYGDLPGLKETYEQFLVNSAFALYRAGQWEKALVELAEVRRLQPDRPGLASALAQVNDKLIETYVKRGDYVTARQLLQATEDTANGPQLTQLNEKWRRQLESIATRKVTQARSLRQAGRTHEAYVATRQALDIWPSLEEAAELGDAIQREHAFVTVGVTQPAAIPGPPRIDNWSSRRAGRLRYRLVAELVGLGSEGGQYECPIGSLLAREDRRQITIQIRRSGAAAASHDFTGFDVARRILTMADPENTSYLSDLNRQMEGVTVRDVYDVDVDLKRPHLRIEALLRAPLSDTPSEGVAAPTAGLLNPYQAAVQETNTVTFSANRDYLLATDSAPEQIIEKYFDDASQAMQALKRGEIDVLDRVFPADVPRLQRNPGLVVESYAIPTIHVLVPNVQRPYLSRRDIRRALVYGINRQEILRGEILGGESIEGCRVISGPLPAGVNEDDPLGYGYNQRIPARPYLPRLAHTLAQLGVRGAIERATKMETEPPPAPSLVLVHPAGELPRIVCPRIARQLSFIGLPCTTRQLEPGRSLPTENDWDLLYLEAMVAEPLVDARRLLGENGVVGRSSAYLSRELHLLAEAASWKEARQRLLEVHRTAHEDVSVVPLWQLVDHFVYRQGLEGIGRRPVSLYANVERWHQRTRGVGQLSSRSPNRGNNKMTWGRDFRSAAPDLWSAMLGAGLPTSPERLTEGLQPTGKHSGQPEGPPELLRVRLRDHWPTGKSSGQPEGPPELLRARLRDHWPTGKSSGQPEGPPELLRVRLRALKHGLWSSIVCCLAALGTHSASAQSTWDASPYQIRVWLALEPVPELVAPWAARLPEEFESTVHATVGVAWDLRVQSAPASLGQDILQRLSQITAETVIAHDAEVQQADKLFLLAVTTEEDGTRIRARELDCQSRQWGPIHRRVVRQPSRLAIEAARLIVDGFAPLVRIEKVEGTTAMVRPRAAFLIAPTDSRLSLLPGTLLRPVVRRNDRYGNPRPGGIQALPWTLLEVLPEPADQNLMPCRVHTGVAQPLRARRSFRIQQLALRVRPRDLPTRLRLVTRASPDRPLAGYDIYAHDPQASRSTFIGRSDWQGVVQVPPGPIGLRMLYVKNGDQLLARLPLVPGELETAIVQLPDDSPRLEAEGFVTGLQEQLIDLMVRRTVLIMRIRQRISSGELDEAQQLVSQLRSLPTRDDLVRELRNRRQWFASDDRRIRRNIDKLFDDLSRRLQKHLDPREIEAVRDELSSALGDEESS